MFSDKFRLLKIIGPLLVVLALTIYGEIKGPQLFPGYLDPVNLLTQKSVLGER
jgi:hypothetical protein